MDINEVQVDLLDLHAKEIEKFGEGLAKRPGSVPDSCGEGWECWYPLGAVTAPQPAHVGLVKTMPKPTVVEAMECHFDRDEWIIAVEKPIIQFLALSSPADPNRPDPAQTCAFLVQPGQAVKAPRGVWHAAAMPYRDEETHYLFILRQEDESHNSKDPGWMPFADDKVVRLK